VIVQTAPDRCLAREEEHAVRIVLFDGPATLELQFTDLPTIDELIACLNEARVILERQS